MDKGTAGLLLGLIFAAGSGQAGQSLSCRVQADLAAGQGTAPKATSFVWSTADDGSRPTGPMKTGIGTIAPENGLKSIVLNGKPVQLPAEAVGLIRFGHVYDYGKRVVVAYRVEREWDATATPSEVVYALDKSRAVTAADILPGSEMERPGHCTLVE